MSNKDKCVNKKLHPYWKIGIYGWIGEEVDDNDYILCPICGEVLGMNYYDYSAENNGDTKCPRCRQEIDYSEIYEFEDTLFFEQLLEIKDDKLADLEAKLEESEKNFVVANNLRKNSDEVLLNYKTEKYGLDKTIQELRKMKLSLPEKEWYYKGFENCEKQMSSHIADLTLEVKQLKQQLIEECKEHQEFCKVADDKVKEIKQQLAEKEKDFKDAEQCAIDYQDRNTELEQEVNHFKGLLDLEVKYRNKLLKSQNQTAIAELEKVKTSMRQDFTIAEDYFKVVAIIDQQIRVLK